MVYRRGDADSRRSSSSFSSESEFTTVGSPTIDSHLDMPDALIASDFESEERQEAGRNSSDSIVVSLRDRDRVYSGKQRCCLHGRRCHVGEAEDKPAEYEPVNLDRLENPPDLAQSQMSTSQSADGRQNDHVSPVVIRCRWPSDMSSIATPTNSSAGGAPKSEIDDGHYENIDFSDPPHSASRGSRSSTRSSTIQPRYARTAVSASKRPQNLRRSQTPYLFKDLYIGAMTKHEAEKLVKRQTNFRLYHRISSRAMEDYAFVKDSVTLYIVYKTSSGTFCHYPIKRIRAERPEGGRTAKYYYVACEDKEVPRFNSLDSLVHYYSVYVQLELLENGDVELFPVPKAKQAKQNQRRAKQRS